MSMISKMLSMQNNSAVYSGDDDGFRIADVPVDEVSIVVRYMGLQDAHSVTSVTPKQPASLMSK